MAISENILTSEKHLELCVLDILARICAKPVPTGLPSGSEGRRQRSRRPHASSGVVPHPIRRRLLQTMGKHLV